MNYMEIVIVSMRLLWHLITKLGFIRSVCLEQNALKNAPERCSADPGMLETISRAVGQQVRIERKDDSRFVALHTVSQVNPDAGLRDDGRATSNVMHVATLLDRGYAFAVFLFRQGQPEWRTKLLLNSSIKDVDQLVRQNNP